MKSKDFFSEMGVFEFYPSQKERFKSGELWRTWAKLYPEIFDELDQEIAMNQASMGYHFFEWLGAIMLYNTTGYLSLVEQYEFKRHRRKQEIVKNMVSPEVLNLINDHETYRSACPDLFVYAPDMSDWFFCEVKGQGDRLRPTQKERFEALARLSGKNIRIIKFRAAKHQAIRI